MRGIIVGSDHKQEWLLSWWWKHYSSHNSYPVVFMDFGLSEEGKLWCQERGQCIPVPSFEIESENKVSFQNKEFWEARFGKSIWFCRSVWFRKPLALLLSPFDAGLWLDLDCQVNGPLEPLFNSLLFGSDIALARNDLTSNSSSQEINYNSGVIAFKKDAPILHNWAEEALNRNAEYPTDQQALCRAIFIHKPSLVELPVSYNWQTALGPNSEALIYHYSDGTGKIEILKQEKPELFSNPSFLSI